MALELTVDLPKKLLPLFTPARYKIAYGGRGSGKSWSFARALLTLGLKKPLRILCGREIQNSIVDSVHRLLSDQVGVLGFQDFYDVGQTTIRGKNGTEFLFAGLRQQDVHKLKSFEGVDIAWMEEAQAISERSWSILTPTIRKPGSEIWVSMNPELDTDPTYQRYVVNPPDGSLVIPINWHDNPWFPAELEAERKDLQKRDPEAYENVWEGKCKSVVDGAIYKREIEAMYQDKRFRNVPYDPILKVHTVWDLGWNDSMAIIFVQRSASEIRIIDYIEDRHKRLDEYVGEIESRKYRWGTDFIPHDGATRDYKSGKSSEEILRSLGRKVQVMAPDSVEEGIKALRMVFPRCYFDERTATLVNCLKRYRRAINTNTNEPGLPVHDQYSHGADAARYMAMAVDQMTNSETSKPLDMRPSTSSWMA